MSFYIKALFFAIPTFTFLIIIEEMVANYRGIQINRAADVISSLSSGLSNIIRDGIKFSFIILSYAWLMNNIAIYKLEPIWIAVIVAFIIEDFAGYWIHRLNHRVNIFWNRHIIHHSSEEFNLSCALRQSISNTFRFSAVFMIPAALLSIPPYFFVIIGPIHLFMQFWYHTQMIDKMGWLEYILVTPSHHRVHHAINAQYIDKNYSQIFIFWDKLFGTFQEELINEKLIYGTLRPAHTYNPIIINFKHLWQLMQDAWHADWFYDKLIIWFKPTGWRPSGVAKKYPIKVIDNPEDQEKYYIKSSQLLLGWAFIQLNITFFMMYHLFTILTYFETTMVLLYSGFLIMNIFSYTSILDGRYYALIGEYIKLGLGLYLLFIQDFTWYGLEGIFIKGFILYLCISLMLTYYFLKQKRLSSLKNNSHFSN